MPILFGAAVAFLTTALLGLLTSIPNAAANFAACCCCAGTFVPFGVVPSIVALRRDPGLSVAQGFAVSFIAVGVGMIAWTVVVTMSGGRNVDETELRRLFEEAQQQMPADNRWTEQELDAAVASAAGILPYVPVLAAAIVTLLSGLIGSLTVAMLRPRHRHPPLHTGDPSG